MAGTLQQDTHYVAVYEYYGFLEKDTAYVEI